MFKVKGSLVFLFSWVVVSSSSAENSSAAYTEDYQQKALAMFKELIAYRTAKGHDQVPKVVRYLSEQFIEAGFPESDVHVLPMKSSEGEGIDSLVVRYRGDGSANKKPILLIAHTDIVEAIPSDWERDPYQLIEEGGYFFGCGTHDNKLGVTALTSTFLRLKADNFIPNRDLIIAFTGDEETEMLSTKLLVTVYRHLTDAEFALNTDDGGGVLDTQHKATTYWLAAAEKTYATYELTVTNPGGHSSMPRADNAIYELAAALKNIQKTPVSCPTQ